MSKYVTVKQLKDELERYPDDAIISRIYGRMSVTAPANGHQKRYITHRLIAVVDDDTNKHCLLLFEEL